MFTCEIKHAFFVILLIFHTCARRYCLAFNKIPPYQRFFYPHPHYFIHVVLPISAQFWAISVQF
jgi:hypothetical protein